MQEPKASIFNDIFKMYMNSLSILNPFAVAFLGGKGCLLNCKSILVTF